VALADVQPSASAFWLLLLLQQQWGMQSNFAANHPVKKGSLGMH
jgi:hypothetical protein